MTFVATLLRRIPLNDRDRRALCEVLADWEHESRLAASRPERTVVDLRAVWAVAKALVLVTVRNAMPSDTPPVHPSRLARQWKWVILAATGLGAVTFAVWVQLPERFHSDPPEVVENLRVEQMGFVALARNRGRAFDITGVVLSASTNQRGTPFVHLTSASPADERGVQTNLMLDSSVDVGSLTIGQTVTFRCDPADVQPGAGFRGAFGNCRPVIKWKTSR